MDTVRRTGCCVTKGDWASCPEWDVADVPALGDTLSFADTTISKDRLPHWQQESLPEMIAEQLALQRAAPAD